MVRFHPRDCPWRAGEGSWQLRGMATDPRVRRRARAGRWSPRAWPGSPPGAGNSSGAMPRKAAVGFYQRIGFSIVTEEYDLRPVGPAPPGC